MTELGEVRDRTWDLFLRPSPPARIDFAARVASDAGSITTFSAFDSRQLDRAMDVVTEFAVVASDRPGPDGLAAVLDRYQDLAAQENPDLLDHALMVFITHDPRGRALTHAIPPVALRNPELVAPSAAGRPGVELFAALPSADGLEWYREDPFANEHHTHWHVVYPFTGVPDGQGGRRFKDRQGEIFLYMHEQMLARYDAERRALGLDRVAPLDDYRATFSAGYDPGQYLQEQGFLRREPGQRMVDLVNLSGTVVYGVSDQEDRRDRLGESIAVLSYKELPTPVPMDDVSTLGSTIEADGVGIHAPAIDGASVYGNLHNIGHGMISGSSVGGGPGVMNSPSVAIRDPVFWEWHKHIDDLGAQWQERSGQRGLDDLPGVRVHDVHLAFVDALPATAAGDLGGWAATALGGGHWDEDDPAPGVTTDALETFMVRRNLTMPDRFTVIAMEHLEHRPFVHLVRLENGRDTEVPVTVRIFLVPVADAEDRRAWIELDKFVHAVPAHGRTVVARPGASSAVIRKPAVMRPELLKTLTVGFDQADLDLMISDGLPATLAAELAPFVGRTSTVDALFTALGQARLSAAAPFLSRRARIEASEEPRPPEDDDTAEEIAAAEEANYCTCGWPYNLLLPRGTEDGMEFRLAVICTDWGADEVDGNESCGSSAFCGARDRYPDRRPMGYPFDRPFPGPIEDVLDAAAHVAVRDVVVRRTADVQG